MKTSLPLLYVEYPPQLHHDPIRKIALKPIRRLISHSLARVKDKLNISGKITFSDSVFAK